jgi:hypothetical protein
LNKRRICEKREIRLIRVNEEVEGIEYINKALKVSLAA